MDALDSVTAASTPREMPFSRLGLRSPTADLADPSNLSRNSVCAVFPSELKRGSVDISYRAKLIVKEYSAAELHVRACISVGPIKVIELPSS